MSPPHPTTMVEDRYAFRHLVEHLRCEGQFSRLYELLEERDFLARQATLFGGFRQGSSDLENRALPVIIGQKDWPRFLRHAVVALGLRGLAEALGEEEVIRALVEHGQEALANDIVEQLTEPQSRIRGSAVILGVAPRQIEDRMERLIEQLDSVPFPQDRATAQAWLATLQTVAHNLGHRLRSQWSRWIERFRSVAPELADDAWLAVAASWREHSLAPDSVLWSALAEVSPGRVLQCLPRWLAATPQRCAPFLDQTLPPPLTNQKTLLEHVRVALLAAKTVEDPWPRLAALSIPSAEGVELGHELWPQLLPEQRDQLAAKLPDATVRAAFRVVVLEGLRKVAGDGPHPQEETAALEALKGLASPARLHWTLRCLAALAPSHRRYEQFRHVAQHLYALRYDIPREDLAHFVDLVAEVLAEELPRILPNVIAAPSSQAETLRTLAMRCQHQKALEELWDNVERYATAAGASEGEGFQLRAEILGRITGRLCLRQKNLERYQEALERLLPDEEDALRLAVIAELESGGASGQRLALEVCGELRSRRLALCNRVRLGALGERLDEFLSPAALYGAVAGSNAVGDELAAIAPLLELPAASGTKHNQQGFFLDLQDSDRRILAVLDLARHDLAFQRQTLRPAQFDPLAALQPLSRVVAGVTTDQRLVALLPELVEVGSQVSADRAAAELQEVVVRLLRLVDVPWPLRSEALERILCHLEPWVLSPAGILENSRCRAVVTFFRWLARLPTQPGLPAGLGPLWPELLPIVLAAVERLPAPCRKRLDHRQRSSIEKLMNWLWGSWRSPWRRGKEGFTAWVRSEPEVLEACLASPQHLAHRLRTLLNPREPSPSTLALLCLLAVRDPEMLPPLLVRLTPSVRREFELRLVRHGWLRDPPSSSLTNDQGLKNQQVLLARELYPSNSKGDAEAIVRGIADALAHHQLDPLDARSAPQRRALWDVQLDAGCAPLAESFIEALAASGPMAGERALCFWVHSWVRPLPGEETLENQQRLNLFRAALTQAESLPRVAN